VKPKVKRNATEEVMKFTDSLPTKRTLGWFQVQCTVKADLGIGDVEGVNREAVGSFGWFMTKNIMTAEYVNQH